MYTNMHTISGREMLFEQKRTEYEWVSGSDRGRGRARETNRLYSKLKYNHTPIFIKIVKKFNSVK